MRIVKEKFFRAVVVSVSDNLGVVGSNIRFVSLGEIPTTNKFHSNPKKSVNEKDIN